MLQLSRQFELVFLLLQKGGISAGEAAARFDVSVRTIYRDVDALSAAGIPIYCQKGRGGGIRFLPEFTMERTYFTQEERRSLLAAVQGLSLVADGESVLPKVAGLFREDARPWIAVDFAQWGRRNEEKFNLIKEAILSGRVLHFRYYNAANQVAERSAEPMQLWFKHQSWYLRAFCQDRQAGRLFKVSRMRCLRLGDEKSEYREMDEGMSPDLPGGGSSRQAMTLQFHPRAAYRVYDDFEDEEIVALPDGSLRVCTEMVMDQWVLGYLLSFGADVLVESPEWLREQVAQEGKNIFTNYQI